MLFSGCCGSSSSQASGSSCLSLLSSDHRRATLGQITASAISFTWASAHASATSRRLCQAPAFGRGADADRITPAAWERGTDRRCRLAQRADRTGAAARSIPTRLSQRYRSRVSSKAAMAFRMHRNARAWPNHGGLRAYQGFGCCLPVGTAHQGTARACPWAAVIPAYPPVLQREILITR